MLLVGQRIKSVANIPGATGTLPGVLGPSGYEIRKTDKGHAIGFNSMENWGGPWIEGSVKEIALFTFKNLMRQPKDSTGFNLSVFDIVLKPIVVCKFRESNYITIDDRINKEELLAEMTNELTRLSKISAFI